MKAITKVFSIMVALTMVLGGFMAMTAMSSAEPDAWSKIDYRAMTPGPEFREQGTNYFALAEALEDAPQRAAEPTDYYVVNESAYYRTYNDAFMTYEFLEFTKKAEGNHCEVWVANDMSWPSGDPRNSFPELTEITQEMVDYMVEQFDGNIWEVETTNYTTPDSHNGNNSEAEADGVDYMQTDDGTKTMIMIWNIRDYNYYLSWYGSYIAGYFSPSQETYYDRNIIHIDCYDWAERTRAIDPSGEPLYEGVIAHEWQHLLQADIDPEEDTWLNEALSMYTEYLCGYAASGYFEDMQFFLDCPNNSLTEWGDQGDDNILADYAAVTLFMQYLDDHFMNATGSASGFIGEIQRDADHQSTDSVEYVLAENGYDMTFDELYENFMIANVFETLETYDNNPYHTYQSWNFSDYAIPSYYYGPGMTLNLNISSFNMWDCLGREVAASDYFDDTWIYYQGMSTGINEISGMGSRVVELQNWYDMPLNMIFDGEDYLEKNWKMIDAGERGMVWYSGASDNFESLLFTTLDLSENGTHTLAFDTYYEIEPGWDFGFVQVSLDNETWTSLENDFTTDEHDSGAMESIVDQLPGLTGYSDDWESMEFDLSEYAGNDTVYLRFNLATDWGYTEWGWMIDAVTIDGEELADDDLTTILTPVSFSVTLLTDEGFWNENYLPSVNSWDFELTEDNVFEFSLSTLMEFESGPVSLRSGQSVYLLITPDEGLSDFTLRCDGFDRMVR